MVQAFTQDLVARIVGLTPRQLDYWDETGVISPSIAPFEGRGLQRLYSFRDLIKVKVGAEMRRRHIRPSRIRQTIEKLEERGFEDPFVSVTFLVEPDGSEVLYGDRRRSTLIVSLVSMRSRVTKSLAAYGVTLSLAVDKR